MSEGIVIGMNQETKKAIIKTSKGEIEYIVGKKIFNEKKFEEGDIIEYELKGKNFNFIKKKNNIEKTSPKNIKNTMNTIFTYPYNFVSLGDPKNINRKSIKENKGNLSGKIKCSLINITPLFIGGTVENKNESHKKESTLLVDGNYIIPSSSLKGEIRNIIEVITNSCIRNVETERLEKRELAGTRENIFGLIKRLPNEKTEEDGLIVEAVKIKVHKEVIGDKKPGFYPIKVNKLIGQYIDKSGRKVYKRGEKDPDAINDIFVYKKIIERGTEDAVLWVSPEISGKQYEKIIVKKDFVKKGEGRNFSFPFNEYEDINYLIAQRNERDEEQESKNKRIGLEKIKVNDPIIFESNDNKVKNLAFSEIPRLRYKCSPYSLVPKEFQQCNSLEKLCFACRLFGTTGNNKEKKEESMVAHVGRVFITDAKVKKIEAKVENEFITLKPLGEPHPSLSRFYLTNGTYDDENTKIRGRKFYWHHSEKIKSNENYKKYLESIKTSEKQKYNSSLKFLKPNNKFEFEVEFKDLTDEELGVLIYSLELEEGLLHKFGKAKAFGFGSSKIEIKKLFLNSENRYASFNSTYKEEDIQKYKEIAKNMYIIESKKEIKELKTILSQENRLDFSKSPFPESYAYNKNGEIIEKKGFNTLNWFAKNKNLKLPNILDYKK